MTPPAIRLQHLTLVHGRSVAVEGLSGCFLSGSLTAVVGPNGAGKTTLLRALAGLHRPAAGQIDRGGLRPSGIALLPQAALIDRSFPLTCGDLVALGHWCRLGPFRALRPAEDAAVAAALAAVGLADARARPIGALSAGQFQRMLFARLIVQDASVILLDEPFNAVDERTQADLLEIVFRWHKQGRTVVAVMHDLAVAEAVFPQALLLARRAVAWGPTRETLAPAQRQRARLHSNPWRDPPAPRLQRPAA